MPAVRCSTLINAAQSVARGSSFYKSHWEFRSTKASLQADLSHYFHAVKTLLVHNLGTGNSADKHLVLRVERSYLPP